MAAWGIIVKLCVHLQRLTRLWLLSLIKHLLFSTDQTGMTILSVTFLQIYCVAIGFG